MGVITIIFLLISILSVVTLNNSISVVICTYNSGKYLSETLNSLIPFTDLISELIIVDAISTDNTINIILNHDLIKILEFQILSSPPSGVADAMNLGAENAKGKYLVFLNSDDYWLYSQKLYKELKEILVENKFDIYLFSCNYLRHTAQKIYSVKLSRNIFLSLFTKNRIFHPSSIVSKVFFTSLGGFNTNYPTAFDYDFWLKASKFARFYISQNVLATFRIHNDSLSYKSQRQSIKERLKIRKSKSPNTTYFLLASLLYITDFIAYILYNMIRKNKQLY
jgi:glycosyltransferase involved in cell wall biosynthesis